MNAKQYFRRLFNNHLDLSIFKSEAKHPRDLSTWPFENAASPKTRAE